MDRRTAGLSDRWRFGAIALLWRNQSSVVSTLDQMAARVAMAALPPTQAFDSLGERQAHSHADGSASSWRKECGFVDEYAVYAEDVDVDALTLKRLEDLEPWHLTNSMIVSIVQHLVCRTVNKEWPEVQLCTMVLLRSDLREVIGEIFAQQLGGLCDYISQLENDDCDEHAVVAKKLARAASMRICDHFVAYMEHIK